MSVLVQPARVFFLIALCYSGTFADMKPGRAFSAAGLNSASAPGAQPMPENISGNVAAPALGSLTPDFTKYIPAPQLSAEPFQLAPTITPPGEMLAKWNELQARVRADARALAACRANESGCSEAARRFLTIVEFGRKHKGRARLGWVNRAVNLSIKPANDWAQYGYADFWASPLQTLGSGAGDCEDYAIVKYAALRELGIVPADLRFVIVQDKLRQAEHAVVAVRHEQTWLILDNRTMAILNTEDARHYRPLFSLDQQIGSTITTAAVDHIIDR
jgi:predicted transglutaminase-like cysteine proteinase